MKDDIIDSLGGLIISVIVGTLLIGFFMLPRPIMVSGVIGFIAMYSSEQGYEKAQKESRERAEKQARANEETYMERYEREMKKRIDED